MKRLKVALLSGISSIHTTRWANALADRGHDIHLITQHRGGDVVSANIKRHYLSFQSNKGYFFNVPFLRILLWKLKPDLLHTHYASGYGTLGRLSGFHPYILSVWGSDVYDFPYESPFKMRLLQKNLRAADLILSTSHVMAKQTHKICEGLTEISITPFGIDLNLFKPQSIQSIFKPDDIVIGTVKILDKKYGIEYLIRAFRLVCDRHPVLPLKLLIVGGGRLESQLKIMVNELKLQDRTVFIGRVPYDKVPFYHNMLSVSVSVSNSESFGVAIIEASACGKPVVVSNVGGLPEVVEDGVTGFIVPPRDPKTTADAIERLVMDESLRREMGVAGRERVKRLYDWTDNVGQMIDVYENIIKK